MVIFERSRLLQTIILGIQPLVFARVVPEYPKQSTLVIGSSWDDIFQPDFFTPMSRHEKKQPNGVP